MRHVNIIEPQVRSLGNQRGRSQDDLAIKLQRAGMESATRSNVSKLEARLIRAIDEDMCYLARVLRVELAELYPERIRRVLDLYEAIRRLKGISLRDIHFHNTDKLLPNGSRGLRLGR